MKRISVVSLRCFAVIIFVVASLSTVPAYAVPVTYTFSGSPSTGGASFSFGYEASDFITSHTILEPNQLGWWFISGYGDLNQVQFRPNDLNVNGWDSIWLSFLVPYILEPFYFGEDSFSTPGTYGALGGNPGTLTVSTPEPTLMILLGISVMSLVGLRRWWKD